MNTISFPGSHDAPDMMTSRVAFLVGEYLWTGRVSHASMLAKRRAVNVNSVAKKQLKTQTGTVARWVCVLVEVGEVDFVSEWR